MCTSTETSNGSKNSAFRYLVSYTQTHSPSDRTAGFETSIAKQTRPGQQITDIPKHSWHVLAVPCTLYDNSSAPAQSSQQATLIFFYVL